MNTEITAAGEDTVVERAALAPGEVVAGKYVVSRFVGAGGMAQVFEALNRDIDERVALKLMHPAFRSDAGFAAKFRMEARAAARIRSESVARVFDVVSTDAGDPVIVMEFLDGLDLRSWIETHGLPSVEVAVGWMIEACAGLAVALRILFTLLVVWLLKLPFLKLIGGVLLLWIATKLVFDDHDHGEVTAKPNLWGAVATIMIADGVMSLDNVLAIVGVAEGHLGLIIFGLVLSIPLVVFGAGFVLKLIDRWPIIVWAGAALLGWVAGEMIAARRRVTLGCHPSHDTQFDRRRRVGARGPMKRSAGRRDLLAREDRAPKDDV